MLKGQPVIYSNPSGLTFLIDPYGIRYKRTKDLGELEDLLVLYPDLWSLVNPPYEESIPRSVTANLPFYVVLNSPQYDRSETLIEDGARKWVVALWNDDELFNLCVTAQAGVSPFH